ncbi:nuclear pore complex protein Nup93-like [Sycon ciliatum]|uniref:nuclear pore complex protein Nup93-like n=1 Tax=Sycon ciliatum TaxID=27933 RepID=UPI0031F6B4B3
MADFEDLAQQAEQLTANVHAGTELPRVQRNLQQIAQAGQRLWTKASTTDTDTTDVKASLLLGSRGFDIPKLSHRLENINAAKSFEPLAPVRDTDIQGFLRNERENALLTAIEETRRSTFAAANDCHWGCVRQEWEQDKQRILQALVSQGFDNLTLPAEAPQTQATPSHPTNRSSSLDPVEAVYARQVCVHNEKTVNGLQSNLTALFEKASEKFTEKSAGECWHLLSGLLDTPPLRSRTPEARATTALQASFIRQGRNFLQAGYMDFMRTVVFGHLSSAQLGGVPSTQRLVTAFLRLQLPRDRFQTEDGQIDGQPIWAILYYCLRCGDVQAAIQVLAQSRHSLGDFQTYLERFASSETGWLPQTLESKMHLEYNRVARHSPDPFKRAVYSIVCGVDPHENHAEVCVKTEDYLWLKLHQAQPSDSILPSSHNLPGRSDQLTYADLQRTMVDTYGEVHFKAQQKPWLYFKVLLLVADFETALEFLWRQPSLRSHAVHFALALQDSGFLRNTEKVTGPILQRDAGEQPQINVGQMVQTHLQRFAATDPREALEYAYILRPFTGLPGEELFEQSVSALALETREFSALLGEMNPDGSVKPGYLDRFKVDSRSVIRHVASRAEQEGLLEDSVHLYDLAGCHDKVIAILNKLISQVLVGGSGVSSTRNHLKALGLTIAKRYRSHGHSANSGNMSSFCMLIDLVQFFDLFRARQVGPSLDVLRRLKLVPLTEGEIEQRVTGLRQYTDEVRHVLPDVLLTSMQLLYQQYTSTRGGGSTPMRSMSSAADASTLTVLRQQARTLITFAGMLPYCMPGDMNARLVQMEVLMEV